MKINKYGYEWIQINKSDLTSDGNQRGLILMIGREKKYLGYTIMGFKVYFDKVANGKMWNRYGVSVLFQEIKGTDNPELYFCEIKNENRIQIRARKKDVYRRYSNENWIN
jgi:hypothetical protein